MFRFYFPKSVWEYQLNELGLRDILKSNDPVDKLKFDIRFQQFLEYLRNENCYEQKLAFKDERIRVYLHPALRRFILRFTKIARQLEISKDVKLVFDRGQRLSLIHI